MTELDMPALVFAIVGLGFTVLMVAARLLLGPSIYDRLLALNTFGTLTVLFIGLLGFLTERPDFLDVALLYALINFISTLAVLKFLKPRIAAQNSGASH